MHPREIRTITPILIRHAEDAAFYWSQLESAPRSYHVRLDDMMRTQNLLAAHLDGLVLAGAEGLEHCLGMLDRWKKSGNVLTCIYVAAQLGMSDQLVATVARVQKQPDELVRGLISGLLHIPKLL